MKSVGAAGLHRLFCSCGRIVPAAVLLGAMLISVLLAWHARRPASPGDTENPATASEWVARAEQHIGSGDYERAELACRAALARRPWHPGAVRTLTLLLLEREDEAALRDWMDDLILGDARLAERMFMLPGFAPHLEHPEFQALFREATIQARD